MYVPDLSLNQTLSPQTLVTGRDPAATPVASLIVLHGLGTTGGDFIPLLRSMNLAAVGPVRCVFPDAPLRTVSFNGSDMHAWHGHDPRRKPGLVLGHEFVGTVAQSGAPPNSASGSSMIAMSRPKSRVT